MPTARLIIDPPASGTWNMAVDEALLESAGRGITTLRFYQWNEPTLSLGYFQAAGEREGHAASRDCPLVRRASGGGAIVHDRELTYCLAAPIVERFGRQANALYDTVHNTLVETLAEFGVRARLHAPAAINARPASQAFLCFQRRTRGDVLCGEAKIAGSAQRRRRGAVLQHGSILLARSPHAPELLGIGELTGIAISPGDLIAAWGPRLQACLGVAAPAELSGRERLRADALVRDPFGAPSFTHLR